MGMENNQVFFLLALKIILLKQSDCIIASKMRKNADANYFMTSQLACNSKSEVLTDE